MPNEPFPAGGGGGEHRTQYVTPLIILFIIVAETLIAVTLLQRGALSVDVLITLAAFSAFIAVVVLFRSTIRRERVFRQLESIRQELSERSRQLQAVNTKLDAKSVTQSAEVTEKVTELERSRTAMISLLEDLMESRDQIEADRAFDNAILASMADGAIVVDENLRITLLNQAAQRMLGTEESDVRGKNVQSLTLTYDENGRLISEDKRPIFRAFLLGARGGVVKETGIYLARADGTRFPVAMEASPIVLNGRVAGVVAVFRDITEQRRIDKSKSEFVSLASHQLRTPLTAISWYVELLLGEASDKLSEQEREYLSQIYQSNRRMIDLIDALLDVSRIEMGSIGVEPEPLDIAKFLHDVIAHFSPLIESKHIMLRAEFSPEIRTYAADPKLLAIIVENLISNAIKYTEPDGTVRLGAGLSDGNLTLTVTDTGIGIPKDVQKRMYEKLFRADNAQLTAPEGSGLGLYLVKSVLDQIGGSITFSSEIGKGTTFVVRLPAGGMKPRAGQRSTNPA